VNGTTITVDALVFGFGGRCGGAPPRRGVLRGVPRARGESPVAWSRRSTKGLEVDLADGGANGTAIAPLTPLGMSEVVDDSSPVVSVSGAPSRGSGSAADHGPWFGSAGLSPRGGSWPPT